MDLFSAMEYFYWLFSFVSSNCDTANVSEVINTTVWKHRYAINFATVNTAHGREKV